MKNYNHRGKKKLDQLLTISIFITFDGIDQSIKFIAWMKKMKKITSMKEKRSSSIFLSFYLGDTFILPHTYLTLLWVSP